MFCDDDDADVDDVDDSFSLCFSLVLSLFCFDERRQYAEIQTVRWRKRGDDESRSRRESNNKFQFWRRTFVDPFLLSKKKNSPSSAEDLLDHGEQGQRRRGADQPASQRRGTLVPLRERGSVASGAGRRDELVRRGAARIAPPARKTSDGRRRELFDGGLVRLAVPAKQGAGDDDGRSGRSPPLAGASSRSGEASPERESSSSSGHC